MARFASILLFVAAALPYAFATNCGSNEFLCVIPYFYTHKFYPYTVSTIVMPSRIAVFLTAVYLTHLLLLLHSSALPTAGITTPTKNVVCHLRLRLLAARLRNVTLLARGSPTSQSVSPTTCPLPRLLRTPTLLLTRPRTLTLLLPPLRLLPRLRRLLLLLPALLALRLLTAPLIISGMAQLDVARTEAPPLLPPPPLRSRLALLTAGIGILVRDAVPLIILSPLHPHLPLASLDAAGTLIRRSAILSHPRLPPPALIPSPLTTTTSVT